MRYAGFFTLIFGAEEKHFRVEFEVDEFDTAGGCLRRVAYAELNRLRASGLRLNRVEPVTLMEIDGLQVAIQPQPRPEQPVERAHLEPC